MIFHQKENQKSQYIEYLLFKIQAFVSTKISLPQKTDFWPAGNVFPITWTDVPK